MSPYVHGLRAEVPWAGAASPEIEGDMDLAPRQTIPYVCSWDKCGRTMRLPFADGVTPQDAWPCRHCGRTARRPGAAPDSEPVFPGNTPITGGAAKGARAANAESVSPMGQLRKRRTEKEGAQILAEAMAKARASGVAR